MKQTLKATAVIIGIEYIETKGGAETFRDYKATERDITLYICRRLDIGATEPPQPPEAPQVIGEYRRTMSTRSDGLKTAKSGILYNHI